MSARRAILRPLSVGPIELRNRVVMAPMTRECASGGVPTREMAEYYRRRAAGGVALIVTEGAAPNIEGSFGSAVPNAYGGRAMQGWSTVVDAVHAEAAAIFLQLWHVGAFNPSLIGMEDSYQDPPRRLSPSGLAAPGKPFGVPMSQADIDRTIDSYAIAADKARQFGFDGIEIHAAHGYLPDQFFWPLTNNRSDRYGGSITGRARFAAEVIRECRHRCGADFPISLRFSQWKQLDYAARIADTPKQLAQLLEPIVDAGASVLNVSTRRFWEPAFKGSERTLAAWTKRMTGKTVIAVGSVTLGNDFKSAQGKIAAPPAVGHLDVLEQSLERGDFDLIAIGRALLANPDWVRIVRDNRPQDFAPFEKSMLESLL